MTVVAERLLTAREFALRPEPEDGSREELVRGVVVTSPVPRFVNGCIQARMAVLVGSHVHDRQEGRVTLRTGVIVETDPDTVRGPDVAYWSFARLPADVPVETYPETAPDLAVEIVSCEQKHGRLMRNVSEYLAAGVRMVWVVDPESRTVTVHRPAGTPLRVLEMTDQLDGADVLPGFRCPVAEVFA